jgi:nitrogen regulatory protein P-II 1
MKEIKAFVHRNRVADIIHGLRNANFCRGVCNLSVVDVAGMLKAIDSNEKCFSIEMGEEVIYEVKLELVCENERIDEAVKIITDNARTGQEVAGWIYVFNVDSSYAIGPG